MIMNRKILGGIFSAALLLGGLAVTDSTPARACNENQVSTWCVDGVKYDDLSGQTFTVPTPPAGYRWTKLILNGGQDGAPAGNVRSYIVEPVPPPGTVITRPGAEVSNAILCKEPLPIEVTPAITPPTCTARGDVIEQPGIVWAVEGDIATATAAKGYRIGDGAQTEFDLSMLVGPVCGVPDQKVVVTEWKDGTFSCDLDHVVQTRTRTTTPYIWNGELKVWELDEANVTTVTETRKRAMTAAEIESCKVPEPKVVTPVLPTVVPPTCEADGYVVLPEATPGYAWVLQTDGTYTAVLEKGYVFPAGAVTTFDPGNLARLTGAVCEVAQQPPPGVPEQQAPPPATTPTAVASAGAELPATGTTPATVLLLGMLAMALGGAVLRISRRPVV
jgi:LPXTG-motif cell wall-anchored protein